MNRRSFLRNSGLATGAAAIPFVGSTVFASERTAPRTATPTTARNRRNPPNITSTLAPFTGTITKPLAAHLLRRVGFAPRYNEVAAIVNGNLATIVDGLLVDQPAPLPPDTWIADQPDLTTAAQTVNNTNTSDFRNWWMHLMYTASNPLLEKMVLFWTNHFVSEIAKVKVPQYIYWQNVKFREFAFGNFKEFVKAITIDNAMVWYLDSYQNTKNRPNENYARELMELFTIGPTDTTNLFDPTKPPHPNYNEVDIQEAARALTGWTLHTSSGMSTYTIADFKSNNFDAGSKTFLQATPGNLTYSDVVDIIFTQTDVETQKNKVALFICTKLYGYFVYDDPGDPTVMPQSEYNRYCNPTNPIIQGLASTFLSSSLGEFSIKAVLRQLFMSEHFFDANVMGAQIKSPVEFMLSVTRQLEVLTMKESDLITQITGLCGGYNQLNAPPNVKGFPGYRTWISTATLPSRNQITDVMLPPQGAKGFVDTIALAKLVCDNQPAVYNSASQLIDACAEFFLPLPLGADEKTGLLDVMLEGVPESNWSTDYPGADKSIQYMLSLLLRFAEFQLA